MKNLFKSIKNFFKEKAVSFERMLFDIDNDFLRDELIRRYGETYGEKYDALQRGETIGCFKVTAEFLYIIEELKKELKEEKYVGSKK